MRILIVSPHFPPWNSVAALRVHAFAKAWAAAGEAVEILTSVKQPDQAVRPLDVSALTVHEVPFEVPRLLRRLRGSHRPAAATVGRPSGGAGVLSRIKDRTGVFSSVRMPDLTDWWVEPAVRVGRALGTFDVIFSSSGPYTAHLAARKLRALGTAGRWVAEYRDLWTQNHLYSGLFPFTIRERLLDLAVQREADLLVTVSRPLADLLERSSGKHALVAYNGFVRSDMEGLDPTPAFEKDGLRRIVYTGKLYPQGQDPRPLLRALGSTERVCLTIAGPDSAFWDTLARELGVRDRVEIRAEIARTEALRMQRDADALAIFEWTDPKAGVLTGKLFEFLAAGPPILVVGGPSDGSIASVVHQTGRGEALGSEPERIAQSLRRILGTPRAGFSLESPALRRFERSEQAALVLGAIRELVGATRR